MQFLIPILLIFLSSPVWACRPMPLEQECARNQRIKLEMKTYKGLSKNVGIFQTKLDRYLDKAFKVNPDRRGLTSCFNNHFSEYYLKGIQQFAKSNKGYFCSTHLPLLYYSIDQMTSRTSLEVKKIVNEKAKMDLLNQAMNISEALLYFKNKHTK